MQRKMVGRTLDMVYFSQSSEYGSCECGRYEEQTKELCDGGFKMAKVSKDTVAKKKSVIVVFDGFPQGTVVA